MKKLLFLLLGAAVALLIAGLAGCSLPGQPSGTPPEGVVSVDNLLAGLDQLEGPSSRSLAVAGRTVFALPGGGSLSTQDLSAYLAAIRNGFASYLSSCTGGHPYLVQAIKVPLTGSTSGLVWVPFTWWKSLTAPVIAYQHGTQVYRECAPSRFNANPLAVFSSPDPTGALQNYVECVVGGLMASAGYIVVMPDYQGFGDSTTVHPYVTQALGDSVRDMVSTVRAMLSKSIVKAGPRLFLTGYSEGGYATMAGARSLQQAGIPVAATVPCDGAYSLSDVMLGQMMSGTAVKVPSYLLYTASGYNALYPAVVTYQTLLADPWNTLMLNDNLFDGKHTNAEVSSAVPADTIPSSMLSDSAKSTLLAPGGDVYNLLAANDGWVGWWPQTPLILVHCRADDVVPYANATAARDYYAGFGIPVPIVDVPPVPFIDTLLGSIHTAAYPTAMLAAFTAIQEVNSGL